MSIFNNPSAFKPFYDDEVTFTIVRARANTIGTRNNAFTLSACVLDLGFDDAIENASLEVTRRSVSIRVMAANWGDSTPPQVGDKVRVVSTGCDYLIARVGRESTDYVLTAREV